MFGVKGDCPADAYDHESDHECSDPHSVADQGFNTRRLGSSERGGKERSRSADTTVQATAVGARLHVHYKSACSDAGWEVPPERSCLRCQAAPTPLPLSLHCHGNVPPSNEKRSIFFITERILWAKFHVALLLALPLAQKIKRFIPKLHPAEKALITSAREKQGSQRGDITHI